MKLKICEKKQDQDFWQRSQEQEQDFHKLNSSDLEDQDLGLEITRLQFL
jgi:hypothetical protein